MGNCDVTKLRLSWLESRERVIELSHLRGRDHVEIAILIGREKRLQQTLKEQILRAGRA